jgi:DNA-binding GntR family transcriptional regulator
MGQHEVAELFAIRTELEALALRHAASRITADELRELRVILDQMTEAAGDCVLYGRLNRDFHLCAYAAQPYARLCTMIESLWDSSDRSRRIFISNAEPTMIRASLAEHEAIYDALARGDGDAAEVFLRAQNHRAAAWLLNHISAAIEDEPQKAASAVLPEQTASQT